MGCRPSGLIHIQQVRSVNALAETVIGLFKTELIKPRGPWRTVEQVEIATLEYVDWFNHRRLFEACGDTHPPNSKPPTTVNSPPSPRPVTQARRSPDTPGVQWMVRSLGPRPASVDRMAKGQSSGFGPSRGGGSVCLLGGEWVGDLLA
jgi:hypothetical protein